MSATVYIITVNYRNAAEAVPLIQGLTRLRDLDACRLIVVNNAATDESAADVERAVEPLRDRAQTLHVRENLFYWGAARFALDRCFPRPATLPDWIIVCNDDVEIRDPSFLSTLLALDPRDHGVIAPSIISTRSQRDGNPFLRSRWGWFERSKWRLYYTHYAVARVLLVAYAARTAIESLFRIGRGDPAGSRARGGHPERIYAPHGAFVIFSRTFFERGGSLDATVRLYAEEITTGEIARRIGVPVVYDPRLRVFHREHATVGDTLTPAKYAMEREAYRHFHEVYWRPAGP
ncbi:MAG: glycosyltransferase family 2 protein [Gemmatimonadetes bacterium]|nr:glycosyltransferase family 2 protein [Gemmatimonadota bacterium]